MSQSADPVPDVVVSLTEPLHTDYWRLLFRNSLPKTGVWLAIVLAIIASVVILIDRNTSGVAAVLIGGAAGAMIVLAASWFTIPYRARRLFRETVALKEPQRYSFQDEGFTASQKDGEARVKWADMAKWDESRTVFAIHPNRMMAYLLPKAQVDPAIINYVRNRLVASGLPKKGKLRK